MRSFFFDPALTTSIRCTAPVTATLPDGTVKTSAAWLIEHSGFARGYGLPGPASLSTKHTLAVTNRGGATASDVLAIARDVRDGVQATFGVTLEPEPTLVGCTL